MSVREQSLGTKSLTILLMLVVTTIMTNGFTTQRSLIPRRRRVTSVNIFFFGGTPEVEVTTSGDSCELVEVRIERTSSNSRRIGGEITVEAGIEDVWAILTDYDNLSTHVPNLVESRRKGLGRGEQGDGSYECRLYQRGAQKIIGFEFGADVTMDMKEKTYNPNNHVVSLQRAIQFKCIDSQFFSEFDGEWRVTASADGLTTTLNYIVDVRPKGIVPVAALEWRIREDVPTNLRAVKQAAITVGKEGVIKMNSIVKNNSARAKELVGTVAAKLNRPQLTPIRVPVWDEEETMAVYLNNDKC